MPVDIRVLPERNLVLAIYTGVAGLRETTERAAECAAHPGFRASMRHLVDLSRITGYERDFPGFFAMQAKVMEDFVSPGGDHIFLFYAPTRAGQEMANMVRRSWEGLERAIIVVHDDEAEALATLGLRERRIEDLVAGVA